MSDTKQITATSDVPAIPFVSHPSSIVDRDAGRPPRSATTIDSLASPLFPSPSQRDVRGLAIPGRAADESIHVSSVAIDAPANGRHVLSEYYIVTPGSLRRCDRQGCRALDGPRGGREATHRRANPARNSAQRLSTLRRGRFVGGSSAGRCRRRRRRWGR